MASQDARLSKFEANFKQQQSKMTNKIDIVLKAITDRIAGALPSDTVKNPKLNTSSVLSARSYPTEDPQCSTHIHGSINAVTIHSKQQSDYHDDESVESEEEERITQKILIHSTELVCTKGDDGDVMFIEIVQKHDNSRDNEPKPEEQEVEYSDTFSTRSEL
ncbi:hypothetical protein Tco_0695426, partial [Tanacetum coccineum]